MAARSDFDIALKYGQIKEQEVADMLCLCKIEVKADDKASQTGNVCVEYGQWGIDASGNRALVPSGIATSKSSWYALRFDQDTVLFVATEKLRAVARDFKKNPNRRKVTGDNGNISVLVPIAALLPRSLYLVERGDEVRAGAG